MFDKFIEYVSKKLISGLWDNYVKKLKERDIELVEITDTFGSVEPLLKYYVEPNCQILTQLTLMKVSLTQ